jgi:hypothetical protein
LKSLDSWRSGAPTSSRGENTAAVTMSARAVDGVEEGVLVEQVVARRS